MEFFGCEVPAGSPTTCSPGYGMYLHISQAALGDSKAKNKNGQERVVVKVQVDEGNEIVLGTLAEGKCDQMHLDLVFDRDFTISHNSKSSSIYICGYRTDAPEEFDDDEDEFEEEDEEEEEEEEKEDAPVPTAVQVQNNGATAGKPAKSGKSGDAAKILSKVTDEAASTVANALAKAIHKTNAKKQVVEDDDSDEEDDTDEDEVMQLPFMSDLGSESDDEEFEAIDDSDEDMDEDEEEDDDDDEDDEDESDESEEEELKTPEIKAGKKRSAAEPVKVSEKKAKTDAAPKPVSVNGKKVGKAAQVAKDAAPKTPTDKGLKPAKTKGTPTAPPPTPVSVKKIGDHKCTGCDRAFTTESALSQHTAAKHK